MKAEVNEVLFSRERDNKHGGKLYDFQMTVTDTEGNRITGYYSTNEKGFNPEDQTQKKFKVGEVAEIEVHEMVSGKGKKWYKFKPVWDKRPKNFTLRKEQSRYSGFAASYAKDMFIAGVIQCDPTIIEPDGTPVLLENLNDSRFQEYQRMTKKIFDMLVDLDKSLE